jgi:hypothetical protein
MARRHLLRYTSLVAMALFLITFAGAQPPNVQRLLPWRTAEEAKAVTLRSQLRAQLKFNGFDDPETKWDDAFKYLERAYDIRIIVNEQAFKDKNIDDLLSSPIGKEVPRIVNIPLAKLLSKFAERIGLNTKLAGQVTWVVRGEDFELTTLDAYRAEFYPGRPNGPYPPLATVSFDKTPLEDALKKLAEETEANVVLDARAAEKAKAPVTARMTDVPLDTAVLLLSDMAGLEHVEVDSVYYVTSKENAESLRKRVGKARPAAAEDAKPAKGKQGQEKAQ